MKRKEFLKKGALGAVASVAGASTLLSSCKSDAVESTAGGININSNKTYKWRMTTVWGKNFPVFGEGANLLAEWVEKMSGGRFKIDVYGSGELVPGLEAFGTIRKVQPKWARVLPIIGQEKRLRQLFLRQYLLE